jgi:hypothetical protein
MVKKGALIGGIITLAGAVLLFFFIQPFIASSAVYVINWNDSDWTWLELAYFADFTQYGGLNSFNLVLLVYYGGMTFAFFNHASSKKAMMKIGSVISGLGAVGIMIMWLFGMVYDGVYFGMLMLFSVGNLLYFIGSIMYRAYHKLGILTSLAMLGMTAAVAYFGAVLSITGFVSGNPSAAESYVNTHLLLQQIQALVIGIHMFLFSFSKSTVDDVDDDEMSVDSDSAFQSYVPDDMKKKNKKKKKEKPSEDIEFQF